MLRAPNLKDTLITAPSVEPVTLAQAKQYARIEVTDDDNLIPYMITAARLECELITRRAFVTQTRQLTFDYFPPFASNYINTNILPALQFGVAAVGGRSLWINMEAGAIRVPFAPLQSVSSITYIATNGTLTTLNSALYTVATGDPGQIAPIFGQIFPLTQPILGAVNVTYVCGLSSDGVTNMPSNIVLAIMALTAFWYEHRPSMGVIPDHVYRLLDAAQWGG